MVAADLNGISVLFPLGIQSQRASNFLCEAVFLGIFRVGIPTAEGMALKGQITGFGNSLAMFDRLGINGGSACYKGNGILSYCTASLTSAIFVNIMLALLAAAYAFAVFLSPAVAQRFDVFSADDFLAVITGHRLDTRRSTGGRQLL